MQTIADKVERLRSAIRTGRPSMREVARRAGVSNSTVKRFVELGVAQVGTVTALEAVVIAPDEGVVGSDVVQ